MHYADGHSEITIVDYIYNKLHQSIVSLQLKPGAPISEQRIALAEGISWLLVREAIMRLSKECLVEVVPKSGNYVGRIPLAALHEALIAKSALEQVMIKATVKCATSEQIMALKSLLEEQREAVKKCNFKHFTHANEAFYELISSITGYASTLQTIKQLNVKIDRAQRLYSQNSDVMQMTLEEHTLIIESVEKNKPSIAANRMAKQMAWVENKMIEECSKFPEYFIQDKKLSAVHRN